ncbi:MAG: hypothetical protein ACO23R_02575 [bacterium]
MKKSYKTNSGEIEFDQSIDENGDYVLKWTLELKGYGSASYGLVIDGSEEGTTYVDGYVAGLNAEMANDVANSITTNILENMSDDVARH